MKQKHHDKNVPQPATREAISRRRLKKFNDQLRERPERPAQFESTLGIAADGGPDAPFRTADEVEALVIDAMRKLANQTMKQCAHEAQNRAVEDCKQEHPAARLKKRARGAGGACMGKCASKNTRCAPRRFNRCGPLRGAPG